MPDETVPSLPDFGSGDSGSGDSGSLERGRFSYLPVVPGRLEFALEVRRRILAERPKIVAVELPATLESLYLDAVSRLPQISVIFYRDAAYRRNTNAEQDDQAVYVPVEPADPFIEAIRSAREIGAQVIFADPDATERPHIEDTYPDSYSLAFIPFHQYVEAYRVYPQQRSEEMERFSAGIAWKLQGADPFEKVLVVISMNLLDPVLDAMERPQPEPSPRLREEVRLVNAHPDCLGEITTEYPFLQERYEQFRIDANADLVDRRRAQAALYREAEQAYMLNTGETIHAWQRRLLARYSRNLARTHNELTASLFDLTISARSIVDENYAWDVWETASRYSHQQTSSDIETANISGEEVWLNTKRIHLRRRLPSTKRLMGNPGLRRRRKEKFPGEWAAELNGNSICSYPPEDIVIEDFGRFLKKKGKSILSEERATVEPFTASLLDGIDLRETIRNWHEGTIYVRNIQKIHGDVGSVVVVFDDDRDGRYNYMTTWLGEHQNESDMAFYSTQPFDHLVGPGIGRAEYGGFLMSLPARRMYDVWADPDYDFAETKAERLLLAGLDYSLQKYVVYVAAKQPRSVFRNIAARYGRTIVYIPIGQLSPVTMKKLRVVHVLDGYDKRQSAKEFIW
jgi:hypothetical protein